jgi:Cof subfamily protein (haloacid dehalogenase superfamily)
MKKLFLSDLDHTLLRSDLSISTFSRDIWNRVAQNSIMGVATARTLRKSEQFLRGLDIQAPMILLDGSLIISPDKKIIDTKILTKDIGDTIIELGSHLDLYPFVLALEDEKLNEAFLYPKIRNSYQDALLLRYDENDNLQERVRAMDKNFKLVYMGDEQELIELKDALYKVFGEGLKYILAPEAYLNCFFLTILHKDADKAHGLKKVREFLDIDFEHYSVFGDNLNDMGMFELAHTSIAVANAHDELKSIATVVLEYTNDEDAVAKYLASINRF